MASVAYKTLRVFTLNGEGGNPLGVVADGRGIADADMQRIATELNYSETVFALPPRDPANTAHVRIFTPTNEIPFAGHPNVGMGFFLGGAAEVFGRKPGRSLRFEELAGIVAVEVMHEGGEVVGAAITAPRPLEIGPPVDADLIARCVSLTIAQIVSRRHAPVFASVGLPFVIAETSLEALATARPRRDAFGAADKALPHVDDHFAIYLYAEQGGGRFRCRMFAPLSNIDEDPATGSAAAAFGALLASLDARGDFTQEIAIEQGIEMGVPCAIAVTAVKAGNVVRKVSIAGRCAYESEDAVTL